MISSPKRMRAVAIGAVVALTLTACGGATTTTSSGPSAAAPSAAAPSLANPSAALSSASGRGPAARSTISRTPRVRPSRSDAPTPVRTSPSSARRSFGRFGSTRFRPTRPYRPRSRPTSRRTHRDGGRRGEDVELHAPRWCDLPGRLADHLRGRCLRYVAGVRRKSSRRVRHTRSSTSTSRAIQGADQRTRGLT